jgi:hypothetical protein
LITKSNLVGRCTGRSAGFSPRGFDRAAFDRTRVHAPPGVAAPGSCAFSQVAGAKKAFVFVDLVSSDHIKMA